MEDAMTRTITIDADQLRQLAEEADSKRGRKLKMVESSHPKRKVKFVDHDSKEEEVSIRVDTKGGKPKKLKVIVPDIEFKDAKGEKLKGKPGTSGKYDDYSELFDCIYWSESAIEKFVVPYYSSFIPLEEIQTRVIDEFQREDVVAFAHLPDSEVVEGEDGGKSYGLVKLCADQSYAGVITVTPVMFP
jgi:hypothetical protein